MLYTSDMTLKNIFKNIDAFRNFFFLNVFALYFYVQLFFLIVYYSMGNVSASLTIYSSIGDSLDFVVAFFSFCIFLTMLVFCIVMAVFEYVLKRKMNFKFLYIQKFPKWLNLIHCGLFYFAFSVTVFVIFLCCTFYSFRLFFVP